MGGPICNDSQKAIYFWLCALREVYSRVQATPGFYTLLTLQGIRNLFKVVKMTLIRQTPGLYLVSNLLSEFTDFSSLHYTLTKPGQLFFSNLFLSSSPHPPQRLSRTLSTLIHPNLHSLTDEGQVLSFLNLQKPISVEDEGRKGRN